MQEYYITKDVKYDLRTRDLLQIPGINSKKIRGSLLWNSIGLLDLIKRASSAAICKRTWETGMERNVAVRYVDNVY